MMKIFLLLLALAIPGQAALTDEPVDDQRVGAELLKFAETQLGSGRSIKVDTLKTQLDRRRCQVAIDAPGIKSDALPAAAQRVRPGVAVVGGIYKCKKCANWHLNAASGFFISSDGVLVTNHHVIASGENETIVVLSGDNRMTTVSEILASDPIADIAILRCEGSGFTALPLSAAAPDGSPVGVWSHPDKRFFSLSAGIIARRFVLIPVPY